MIDALWGAKVYRPDGIVTLSDVFEEALKEIEWGLSWWSETLTELTYGRRYGEIYTLGAGTGVGKTDFLTQQVVHDVTELGQKVGLFFLEQQPVETVRRVAGKYVGRRFHIPDDGWTKEELTKAITRLNCGKLFLYDHFGVTDWDVIQAHIRYLAIAEGVRIFYLDHLTALAAAEEDERKALEKIMAEIGGLVKALDVMVILVSHLTTPDGKPHEEGGRVTIRHFKGSRAIGFWSHYMLGFERDQQAEDEEDRTTTTYRVLKDRYAGTATGQTFLVGYEEETGRLFEKGEENPFAASGENDDIPF